MTRERNTVAIHTSTTAAAAEAKMYIHILWQWILATRFSSNYMCNCSMGTACVHLGLTVT